MSWEGYGQALCENGHRMTLNPYEYAVEEAKCEICQTRVKWVHWVDETNGCECNDNSCCAHPLPLEIDKPATYEECPHCQHRKLLTEMTHKIPNDGRRRS